MNNQLPYTKFQELALLILRVTVAAIFLHAAYVKLPFWAGTPEGVTAGTATLMKFLSIIEPLGALAVLFGFLTRWAAAGLAIIMAGAIFILQFSMHVGFATPAGPGWNFPLSILAGCIVLASFGAGRWSADAGRKSDIKSNAPQAS